MRRGEIFTPQCLMLPLCAVSTDTGLPSCESGVTQLNQWNYSGFSPAQGHAAFGSEYSAARRNLTLTLCVGSDLLANF